MPLLRLVGLLMRVLKVHMGAKYVPDPVMRAQGYPYAVTSVPVLHPHVSFTSYGGYPEETRVCIGNKGQECPECGEPLHCINDYVGGGSHYWHLRCLTCNTDYSYDTHTYRLYRPLPREVVPHG